MAEPAINPDDVLVKVFATRLKAKGIRGVQYMVQSVPENLKQLAELIDAGKLKPVIAEILPLKEIVKAHQLSEGGHTRG